LPWDSGNCKIVGLKDYLYEIGIVMIDYHAEKQHLIDSLKIEDASRNNVICD
jgi:hypothetical protein